MKRQRQPDAECQRPNLKLGLSGEKKRKRVTAAGRLGTRLDLKTHGNMTKLHPSLGPVDTVFVSVTGQADTVFVSVIGHHGELSGKNSKSLNND